MATLNYSAYRIPSKIQEALSYKGSACLDHGTIGDKDGYNILTICHKGHGKQLSVRAHRYLYFIQHPETDDSMVVRHICNNPRCINPSHLLAGTVKDNNNDKVLAGTERRLTASEVEYIRSTYSYRSRGRGVQAIARKLGVSPQTVHNYLTGKRSAV